MPVGSSEARSAAMLNRISMSGTRLMHTAIFKSGSLIHESSLMAAKLSRLWMQTQRGHRAVASSIGLRGLRIGAVASAISNSGPVYPSAIDRCPLHPTIPCNASGGMAGLSLVRHVLNLLSHPLGLMTSCIRRPLQPGPGLLQIAAGSIEH